MEGSNLRPPRCERGALTTELTAPSRWDELNYRHTPAPTQATAAVIFRSLGVLAGMVAVWKGDRWWGAAEVSGSAVAGSLVLVRGGVRGVELSPMTLELND